MEKLNKSIPLRLRFYLESDKTPEFLLDKTKAIKNNQSNDYEIKMSENHIWLNIAKSKRKYYSPHLHVEFEPKEDKTTHIRALFGPDPTLWTLFMFLHFVVAGIFIFFSARAYSHWILKASMGFDFTIMGVMVVLWFALYGFARYNRSLGVSQMYELRELLNNIVEK